MLNNHHDTSSGLCEEPPVERSPLLALLEEDNIQQARELLATKQPAQIIAQIATLPAQLQATAFYSLTRDKAIEVYQFLDTSMQQRLLENFKVQNESDLVGNLSPDERVQLFKFLYTPDLLPDNSQDEESSYFPSSPLDVTRRRIGWLLVLLVTNTITAAVIQSQEDILQQVVVLAIFIPLLLASGGNVSIQAATVVVRGLNSDLATQNNLLRVLAREAIAGILLGAILGIIVIGEAWLLQNNSAVAIVVGVSLFAISILGTVSGALLPFLFRFLGFDPALMAAPLSATIVDVVGILIYLYLARLILHI